MGHEAVSVELRHVQFIHISVWISFGERPLISSSLQFSLKNYLLFILCANVTALFHPIILEPTRHLEHSVVSSRKEEIG